MKWWKRTVSDAVAFPPAAGSNPHLFASSSRISLQELYQLFSRVGAGAFVGMVVPYRPQSGG